MAIHGNTWVCMAGITWLYMGAHGNALLYTVIHARTWHYMAICGKTR